MELALETQGLRRAFGDLVAVAGIDLAVPKGSVYGFLGPNGAGKSTTLNCLTGLLRPTAGLMRVLGIDPLVDAVAVKRRIGVVPESLALFERLTGRETLRFVGQVHGLDSRTVSKRSDDLLASVFPDQVACQENIVGEIRIPSHPLVDETIRDCLHEAMDLEGLRGVLAAIDSGEIETRVIDTAEPSVFCHELLNANPYAFLDDAPLEERRARAV